jgi:hypothetical protein
MSRIVTILGVIYAVALAISPDLVAINPTLARYAMLLGLAAAAAGKALTAQDVRDVRGLLGNLPKRGMYASRKALKLIAVIVLSVALLAASACGGSLRGTARGIEVGAQEIQREIKALVQDGDITPDDGVKVISIAEAVEGSAHALSLSAVNFKALTPSERRALILQFIGEIEVQAGRLDGLAFKSEKARKKLANARRTVRLGISALRVIEASIPQKDD